MKATRALLVAFAGFVVTGTCAMADILLFADLTNSQENPPATPTLSTGGPRPASFGSATFILNDAMTALSFTATIHNIDVTGSQTPDPNDNLTNAHIHASATVTPTTNAGVVWGFHGTPFHNDDPNDGIVTPFASGVGGTFSGVWNLSEGTGTTTLTDHLPNILSGRAYMNFHTAQFGGGEIRGAILPVPDGGATLLLLSSAFLGLAGLRLKLRQLR